MPQACRLPALLLLAACAACSPLPPRSAAQPLETPHRQAAPDWLLEARSALDAGDPLAAERALSRVDPSRLASAQAVRFQTLQARALLLQDQPQRALQALPEPWAAGDRGLAAEVEALRAEAYLGLGQPVAAVSTLVQREALLDTPAQILQNQDRIWSLLMQAPLDAPTEAALAGSDRITRGWFELAQIVRSGAGSNRLADWRVRYPNHPGELSRAASRPGAYRQWQPDGAPLDRVALLLPLSGRYAAPANAVREGFFAAWAQSGSRPAVQVFDTGEDARGFDDALRGALDGAADFIVGPLQKEHVARLAAAGAAVPVLALNYLDSNRWTGGGLFQFGLAPEDEARQVAVQAAAQQQRRAIVLVPDGDWGDRVYSAFAGKLSELGGEVVAVRRYRQGQSDFSEEIQELLALRESRERNDALRAIIGYQTEFQTRPRSDVDFAFIAAAPTQARSIRSQFRYFHASDLPIYATSVAYDGRRDPSDDLDGLRFCDMPWMLQSAGPVHELRRQIQAMLTPVLRSQTRLIALGYDAYGLMQELHGGRLYGGVPYQGVSGALNLDSGNAVRRQLQCAIVQGGGLRMLPPATAPSPAVAAWP